MSTPTKYRKKPVVIEAMRWPGREGTAFDDWLTADDHRAVEIAGDDGWADESDLLIHTPEGTMRASVGDYVIRGMQGELYPCKSDIFEATYERVADDERTDSVSEVRGDEAP